MSSLLRYAVPATLVAIFLALATVSLDKPGYYYDEVIFVPVSLRVLGYCDVDANVTLEVGCLPLMQTLGYVGAVKAWLHAPLFAVFGTNVWTVRLPSILFAAAALVVLWSFVRRELGGAWAALLLVLLVTDPVLLGHARLDWGPQMIAAFLRVLALVSLWRWLQTGRMHWLVTLCAAFLIGFVDKINFIWVIAAFSAAALAVAWRHLADRLRSGWPWQPALAALTAALLAWGAVTLVRSAAQLDILGDAGTLSWSDQVAKVWNLFAATFSGSSVVNWVFGFEMPVTSAFNILALLQFGAAVVLLARWRPWTPARRLLAFVTAASAFLVIAIVATRQVGGSHHLVTIWPMPALHLVILLAIAAQHGGGTSREPGRGFQASVAVTGAVVCGALLAWNIAITIRHVDAWRHDRDFRAPFDPAIGKLASRLDELGVDRVISVDWGLHQQLVTLADRSRAGVYREWTWRLIGAPDLDRPDLREAVAAHLRGKRVAFVLHAPRYTVFPGARGRLDALLARDRPCNVSEESFANSAGKKLYTIVFADYRDCGATGLPKS